MAIHGQVLRFKAFLLFGILLNADHHHGTWGFTDESEPNGLKEEWVNEKAWTMVEKKGNQFVVDNHPFYFNGFNTYWLMVLGADQSTRGKVTEVFQQAASVGLTVCRTLAFNDGGWRALQKSPSVYDEEVFKALDFVVSEAKKYRIRLILSLVNNWKDFGGKPQYVDWGKADGFELNNEDDFFSHPAIKTYYKNHVKTVLNRVNTFTHVTYKEDPTIFAWELMNEPRCTSDPSGNVLQNWIQEMAAYVKSIDPKHLVEIGLEGFYGPSTPNRAQTVNPSAYSSQVGTDFIRNHQAQGVDFASVHIYPDTWISTTISEKYITFYQSWMQDHIQDAEKLLGMPVVFGEFGISSKDIGFNSSFKDEIYSTAYSVLLDSAKHGGAGAGTLFWQLFVDGTENMDDGYAVFPSKSPHLSKIIALQSTSLRTINSAYNYEKRSLMAKE
ncbi:Mannan endo-1,4-beta-mannosidase 6 [Dionaea muscipula]